MTPRQAVTANIEFAAGDERIGFHFTGVPGRRDDFTGAGCVHGIQTEAWQADGFDYYTDIWGNTWYRKTGWSRGGEVFAPALKTWADLERLELPDLDNPAHYEAARQLGAADTDRFRLGWLPGFPFAICRYLRRMEVYFTDLIAHRGYIDSLHDRVTSLLEGVIDRFGEAGLDGVMFCEDLGTQERLLMSPAMWRDIFRPLYERLTACAHGYGMKVIQHSCGFNWLLIDDLCGAGIDCLQFDQPAVYDLPALATKLGGHGVGLYAPADIQQWLPTGDRDLIEARTARLVELFRGGLIAKNYGDLHGIGVDPAWDGWAYETFVRTGETRGRNTTAAR